MSDDRSGASPPNGFWRRALRTLGLSREDEGLRENLEALLGTAPDDKPKDEAEPEPRPALGPEEKGMLANILRFGEMTVADVMVPRADIVAVEDTADMTQAMRIFVDSQHSRLPVYRESLDDVGGMIHLKDLAPYWSRPGDFRLRNAIRKVPVVPASMRALKLLAEMRRLRTHLAVVVDEYGGVDGLVTIEDLVERIVGDIEDEYDTDETPRIVERDGVIEADGRAAVEEIEKRLGYRLRPDGLGEEIDTVGGLVAALIGRVPAPGEKVESDSGVVFEILDADRRRIKRLVLRGRRRDGEDGA